MLIVSTTSLSLHIWKYDSLIIIFQVNCEYIKPQEWCHTISTDDYGLSFQSLRSRWSDTKALWWEKAELNQAWFFLLYFLFMFLSSLTFSPQKRPKGCLTISWYCLTYFLLSFQLFCLCFWQDILPTCNLLSC